jgi:hypothetical protein
MQVWRRQKMHSDPRQSQRFNQSRNTFVKQSKLRSESGGPGELRCSCRLRCAFSARKSCVEKRLESRTSPAVITGDLMTLSAND